MNYEKLHKDTITNLQEMVNSGKITVEIARKICADFVPESEDEMTRQEMLAMFSNADDYRLEKEFVKRAIVWLKKQCKQKPADKVEPKFKVGDYIKHNKTNMICKIISVNSGSYYVKNIKTHGGIELFNAEQDFHLLQYDYNPYKATMESIAEMCKHYDIASHSSLRDFYNNVKVKYKDAIEYGEKYPQKQQKPSKKQNIYKNGVYQETNGVRIWHNGHTFLVPKDWNKGEWPLLNEKGIKNSEREKQHLMNEIDALLDWKFVAATKHIQDLGTDIPLKDGEYLITAPIWLAMYKYRVELNKALSDIGAMEIDFNKSFWFAQQCSIYSAWFFYGYSRSLSTNGVGSAYQVGVITF